MTLISAWPWGSDWHLVSQCLTVWVAKLPAQVLKCLGPKVSIEGQKMTQIADLVALQSGHSWLSASPTWPCALEAMF